MWTSQSAFGNFDRCATLSTALVSVEGATGSSPITALMFHRGKYLGTATYEAYGFTSLNAARTTDDTVVLNYKTPGACNACPPAGITSVRYQWQGDHVEMLDPAPVS
ncbi:LppP/LprE family lipoprotein [Mycolicibacterium sp. GCM10028919]|uniref:LppP/LprE family lipoprotein n=1 Tax=Mycolicibacterium sp. GCM10028919 TaxID=3273401 RepID=UPI003605E5AB